ncbi:FkbM family methyltransferase [Synechococcus sp. BA-132 BA5]|uniref:FkbM family methyltransferase n=1 Tax=Synechococcus sp. BA-132 BA5 TaxID=3110252 RepID=UPI002B21AFA8|nr:FkbM family methyltransferase [Synechococcus sp. BA-132 BA5]MEA5414580.1 FkbM family methyltransferase [Synechococcus sp. BA-132 BA5]
MDITEEGKSTSIESYADPLLLNVISTTMRILPRGRGMFARWMGSRFSRYLSSCHLTTRYGAKLAIAPSSLDLIATAKIWDNAWEHWVYDSCKWVMPPNGVIYDIGANVGYIAVEMLHELPGCKGVLFEPQPALAQALRRSVELNSLQDRASLLEIALSDSSGMASLNLFRHDGHASLSNKDASIKQINVPTMTLDEAVHRLQLPLPDVIKIDVEGHEINVIDGGATVLKQAKPNICFECSDNHQLLETKARLARCGHYIYLHATGSYRPIKTLSNGDSLSGKTDILAIESSRRDQLPPSLQALFVKGSEI